MKTKRDQHQRRNGHTLQGQSAKGNEGKGKECGDGDRWDTGQGEGGMKKIIK